MRVLRSQHSISDDNEGTGTGISGNVSGVSITYASRSEMSIKTFTLDVEMTDTIQIVKTKIQNKVSIPADRQKLSLVGADAMTTRTTFSMWPRRLNALPASFPSS